MKRKGPRTHFRAWRISRRPHRRAGLRFWGYISAPSLTVYRIRRDGAGWGAKHLEKMEHVTGCFAYRLVIFLSGGCSLYHVHCHPKSGDLGGRTLLDFYIMMRSIS